jgi:hypothetical protein
MGKGIISEYSDNILYILSIVTIITIFGNKFIYIICKLLFLKHITTSNLYVHRNHFHEMFFYGKQSTI